jgi:NhaP-type Na+/H+ or K+/H+ antiporter
MLCDVEDTVVLGLGTVVVLGVGMQWLARRLRFPAIVLLLAAGLVAGPALGLVETDEIFGDSLFPVVSMAVGILLFEGGLGLDIAELRTQGARPVVRLVTLGVVITWLAVWAVSVPLFGLPGDYGALLGALLVVSGPTVVGPLLRVARPRPPASVVLRWEGIVIDPVGATLALVVLGYVLGDGSVIELFVTAGVGVLVGLAASTGLVALLRRFLVPDDLELAVTTMFVIGAYAAAELMASEAGLFATTALGVALANQRFVQVRRITTFNRDIGVLVLGGLFILLAARIDVDALVDVLPESLLLVAFLVLVVRPVVAWACTARTGLSAADRTFIGGLCPRGIVAAATSALFAIELSDAGRPSNDLDAIVFVVIVGTCVVYGIAAAPLARRLGLALPLPTGVVLVGAQDWMLSLADRLVEIGVPTSVVATGRFELRERARGWRLFSAPLVTSGVDGAFDGAHSAVIASIDDEHNAVALARCLEDLPRARVHVLPATSAAGAAGAAGGDTGPPTGRGRRWLAAVVGPLPEPDVTEPSADPDGLDPNGLDTVGLDVADDGVERVEPNVGSSPGGEHHLSPSARDTELVELAPASGWSRRPFAGGVTQRALDDAWAQRGEVRSLTVPAGDRHHRDDGPLLPAGSMVLVVRHRNGQLDLAPRHRAPAPGDTVLYL